MRKLAETTSLTTENINQNLADVNGTNSLALEEMTKVRANLMKA
nr:hypothetical protein [Bacillus sp. T33-2]